MRFSNENSTATNTVATEGDGDGEGDKCDSLGSMELLDIYQDFFDSFMQQPLLIFSPPSSQALLQPDTEQKLQASLQSLS
ncbi:hypothetical protein GOBAR_DD08672 [Gossypium barbadense]|nr:hypothetical protein GOBAR_DD08672 [Gossypium barbadense]